MPAHRNILLFILVLSLTFSCINKSQIDQVNWLIGTWANETSRGTIFESWSEISRYELAGKSFKIDQGDTVILETVKIIERNNELAYIPRVQSQNDNKPISFSLRKLTRNEMVFENLSHDFPNIISYRKINQDSLLAFINGKEDNLESRRYFPMRKIN